MIRISVLYPNNNKVAKFDMAYYCNTHIPMVRRLLGSALKGVTVEHGIAGSEPSSPAPYVALGHLSFDSLEAFQTAFAPHAQTLMEDIPNYTDVVPTLQISEVKI